MHIMAPMANLSYPLQCLARSISRLAASPAGSARHERKMRYQRRNSCSDSATKIHRFFGVSFRRSKSLLAESRSEENVKSRQTDAPDRASLNSVELEARRAEILHEFDEMLASQEGKPKIPPKPEMYAIPDSLHRRLKNIDDTQKNASNTLSGKSPVLHHITADPAAWGPSLRPRAADENVRRPRWVHAEIVK